MPKPRLPKIARHGVALTLSLVAAYCLYHQALPLVYITGWATVLKLQGRAPECGWSEVLRLQPNIGRFRRYYEEAGKAALSFQPDPKEPFMGRIELSERDFWVRPASEGPGVAWLIAEHRWMDELAGEQMVQEGDIVLDIGAHVGFFVREALRRGAEKVIAVEPDPRSVACLRRNFPDEIASGRVTIQPWGAWRSVGEVTLHLGADAGWNSMVEDQGGESIEVPVRPIDDMVAELGLPHVDFIKMDIEGAEVEALLGAAETLRRFAPVVMIDTYSWAYEMDELIAQLRTSRPGYEPRCGPCEPTQAYDRIIPHMTFYRAP